MTSKAKKWMESSKMQPKLKLGELEICVNQYGSVEIKDYSHATFNVVTIPSQYALALSDFIGDCFEETSEPFPDPSKK